MKFIDFISKHRLHLENFINEYLDNKIKSAFLPDMKKTLEKTKDCVNEGKMIRGMLVLLSAQMHGKEISKEVYAAAGALEIFQTALLIHDDIMDNDHKRRNKDSMFYQYVKEGKAAGASNPLLYGQSMGLCVGDSCFFMGFELLALHVSDQLSLKKMITLCSQEFQLVTPAQMADTSHGMLPIEPSPEEIIQTYLYKTAHYSFSLPLMIGAAFSSAQSDDLLRQYGGDVGIIFQLKDDELGIFGAESDIGKQVGSDIRENKKTLIRLYTFENADEDDKKRLASIFGNPTILEEELEFVRECVKKYGGLEKITKEIEARIIRVNQTLDEITKKGIPTEILKDLISFNLNRNK